MSTSYKTKLFMDSGKEYILNKHPEDLVEQFKNQDGDLINSFIQFEGLIINPSHVSSLEYIEEVKDVRYDG
ncbi:hypothetical protein SAMN04488137_2216 [Fictibacillus solisalsi]|uniref:Uncharacterized protein n=1 Tax=Fictibacillus solisalsi TaxID=459525 RepID=A0A1G9WJD6_9BACL|nr:hypothetical protein [Fictibacillus solisalsi]SDM84654.1 hypothetical protein SAMN04488137_2216 [Fictibacillus solisalsi]